MDLDGNPRIVGGTVDIGAYEYQTPTSILSYAWAQQYGLPTDGSADLRRPGRQRHEYLSGMDCRIESHQSRVRAGHICSSCHQQCRRCDGDVAKREHAHILSPTQHQPCGSPAFSTIQSNIVGQTGTTSYTDTTATNGGPYFYRVGVQ